MNAGPSPPTPPRSTLRTGLLCVFAAAALLACLLAATVRWSYGGQVTGLFLIGDRRPLPPVVAATGPLRQPNSYGYDGQFYLALAADPLLGRETVAALDNPALRARRILLPALAHALALGDPRREAQAFVLVVCGFVLLGVWWSGQIAAEAGRHPAWGLLFLLLPASIVSLDRMLTDAALCALAAGLVRNRFRPCVPVFLMAAAAPLVRETGLAFPAALMVASLPRARWRDAAMAGLCLLPAAAWFGYVFTHTEAMALGPDGPFHAFWNGLWYRADYGSTVRMPWLVRGLDRLALLGAVGLLGGAVWGLRRMARAEPGAIAAGLMALAILAAPNVDLWYEVLAYGRVVSPLLVLGAGPLVVAAAQDGRAVWWRWLPWALMLPRTLASLLPEMRAVWAGLLG